MPYAFPYRPFAFTPHPLRLTAFAPQCSFLSPYALRLTPYGILMPFLPRPEKSDQGLKVWDIRAEFDMIHPHGAKKVFSFFQPLFSPFTVFLLQLLIGGVYQVTVPCFRVVKPGDSYVWHIQFNGIREGDGNQVMPFVRNR